jgi:plasmid replication initiation protein
MHFLDIKNKREYKDMKLITKGLMNKGFEVKEGNRTLQINWFASAEYFDTEGIVEIEFSQKLKPFLLQLKNCFTSYEFGLIKNMKGQYSIRIHDLLKQYEKIPSKSRSFLLTDLRKTLGIEPEQYPNYADFKKRVITSSQKEMEEYSDITFDLEEIKDGKKVVELKFYIKEKVRELSVKPEVKVGTPIKSKYYSPIPQHVNFEQRKQDDDYYKNFFNNSDVIVHSN